MSSIQEYLQAVDLDKTQAQSIAKNTASQLLAKQVNLIEVIESLGDYVKSPDNNVRSSAIQYLSHVLAALPPSFLSRQQLAVIAQFLCNRMEDDGVLAGLLTLQHLPRFNDELAVMTTRALLSHASDFRTRPQIQRFRALELLSRLISKHRKAIQSLGTEALVGISGFVGGEKDPRNLMVIFSILNVIMAEWDLSNHEEMLFESVFCYYPITFRPPPDDAIGITADDLKFRLRECLAASSAFAPYAFPQLIEKLDSASSNIKKDVLETLSACIKSYQVRAILNYCVALWDSLKYELFNMQEDDVAEQAFAALQDLATRLCVDGIEGGLEESHGILTLIVAECVERLQQPQQKQAQSAGRILHAFAKITTHSLQATIQAALPKILVIYEEAETIEKRRAAMEPVKVLLESAHSVCGYQGKSFALIRPNPILLFQDRLFRIFSQALVEIPREESSYRILVIKCLVMLCTLPDTLHNDNIASIVQDLVGQAIDVEASAQPELRQVAIEGLLQISKVKAQLISDMTIPKLLSQLPTSYTTPESSSFQVLDILASLGSEPELSNLLLRQLFSHLDAAINSNMSARYCEALLCALYSVLNRSGLMSDSNLVNYRKNIIELLRLAANLCTLEADYQFINKATFGALGKLTSSAVQKADQNIQSQVAQQVYSLYTGSPVFIGSAGLKDISFSRRLTIALSTHLLASLPRTAHLPPVGSDITQLVEELGQRCLVEESPDVTYFLLEHTAIVVNKFMDDSSLREPLRMVCEPTIGLLGRDMSEQTIRLAFWISKALILRLYFVEQILTCLIGLLSDVRFGSYAACGFEMLLSPHSMLSKECGANIRLLAKQKVLTYCSPIMAGKIRNVQSDAKHHHVRALCGILKHVGSTNLILHLEVLWPLLLQGLDLADSGARAAIIEALTIVAHENAAVLEEHVPDLLLRLLAASSYLKETNSSTRFKAIQSLSAFARHLRHSILLPHLKTIDHGLSIAIGDPRRDVRKEAVDCRDIWMNVESTDLEN